MKKQIYFSMALCAALHTHSQITLTQTNNAPASGDVQSTKYLDSTATLDKSGGASKTWNYSSSVTNSTNTAVSTISYTTASSIPGASMFTAAGANVAAKDSSQFLKSGTNALEMIGQMQADGSVLFLSNTMKLMQFPFTYPNNYTDTYSGTQTIPSLSGTLNISGNISTSADGYGTIILPSSPTNLTFNNVLRVKQTNTMNINGIIMGFPITGSVVATSYFYFKSGTKNPFFQIIYQYVDIPLISPPSNQYQITYNAALPVSVQEITDNTPALFIYPNPSSDILNIQKNKADYKTAKITDIQGKTVREFSLNNNDTDNINIHDLNNGTYILILDNSPSRLHPVSHKFVKE